MNEKEKNNEEKKERKPQRSEGNALFNDTLDTFLVTFLRGKTVIWRRTTQEIRWCIMGYSFRLAARVILCASYHRQDNTAHGLCYTSRGALAGMKNSSIVPPRSIDPTTHCTRSGRSTVHRPTKTIEFVELFQNLVTTCNNRYNGNYPT